MLNCTWYTLRPSADAGPVPVIDRGGGVFITGTVPSLLVVTWPVSRVTFHGVTPGPAFYGGYHIYLSQCLDLIISVHSTFP